MHVNATLFATCFCQKLSWCLVVSTVFAPGKFHEIEMENMKEMIHLIGHTFDCSIWYA